MEKEITLVESLTGLEFVLTHLDGKKIRIKNNPGEVIKPDQLLTVENLGMPFHKKVYMHGNLIIQFKIKFPTQVDQKTMALLGDALSEQAKVVKAKRSEEAKEASESVNLKQFEEHHRNTHHQGGTEGGDSEEEDEDGHGQGQRIGCQSQ